MKGNVSERDSNKPPRVYLPNRKPQNGKGCVNSHHRVDAITVEEKDEGYLYHYLADVTPKVDVGAA